MPFPQFEAVGQVIEYFQKHPKEIEQLTKEQRKIIHDQYEYYEQDRKARPIYYFEPNLPQSKLIYSLNHQGQMPRVLMFEGSNKSGKTSLAVAWQIAMGVGFFPWLKDLEHFGFSRNWKTQGLIAKYCGFKDQAEIQKRFCDIKKLVPKLRVPNVNLAIGETYTESVDKDLVPKYLEMIPKDWKPEPKKNQQGVIHKISLKAGPGKGSVFYFRSYKSTPDEFEGIDVSGSILYNEPPPQEVVTAVNRGALPFDTRAMFAFTALKEPWIYRDFVNKAANWLI